MGKYLCMVCGSENDDTDFCQVCHVPKKLFISIEHFDMPKDDIITLARISNDEHFLQSMNTLYNKDVIEYNLKLSQFKTNAEQQKQATIQQNHQSQSQSNQPHCPTCGSTNISKIGTMERAGSIALWGLFSKKINKTFKCNSCGHTW